MNTDTHTTDIDITALTPAQLKAIQAQLKAVRTEASEARKAWQTTVDAMLAEKTHTTLAIWEKLHSDKLVDEDPATTTGKDRDRVLKRIQARCQKLKKAGEDVDTVRTIVVGRPAITLESVLDWFATTATAEEIEKLREEIA